MPQQAPSLDAVSKFIKTLRTSYIGHKKTSANEERLKDIGHLESLLDKVKEPDGSKVLLGAMLFFGMRYSSGALRYFLLTAPNSPLMTFNVSSKHHLIYLNELLNFANANKIFLDFATHTDEKENIAEFNKAKIKPVSDALAKEVKPHIDDLCARARIITIPRRIANLPDEYKEAKDKESSSYLPNFFDSSKERNRSLAVARILSQPYISKILDKMPPPGMTDLKRQFYIYTICCGYLIDLIQKTPHGYLFNSRSKLRELCVDIFGTDDVARIPAHERKIYISNFRDFIPRAMGHDETLKFLANTGLFSDKTTPEVYLRNMATGIDNNHKGYVGPIVLSGLMIVGSSVSSFVIGIQIGKAASHIWNAGYGKGILPILIEEAGEFFGGPVGRKIGQMAGPACEEAIGPAIIAKTLNMGCNQVLSSVFESPDAAMQREAKATQNFTLDLTDKVDQTLLKKEIWLDKLIDDTDFLLAIHAFYPEESQRLRTIIEAGKLSGLDQYRAEKARGKGGETDLQEIRYGRYR